MDGSSADSIKKSINEKYVYKLYLNIYLIATLIIGISEIVQYKSLGEAPALILSFDRITLVLLLIIQVVSITLVLPVFGVTKKIRFVPSLLNKGVYFEEKRSHIFIFVLLCLNIVFTFKTGNGVVGSSTNSSISFIFNIIKIKPLMALYYVYFRNSAKKCFWVNSILYFVYELLCGWTGFILFYFICELFLFVRRKENSIIGGVILRFSSLLSILAMMCGAFLYRYLIEWKYRIRLGISVGIPSYSEALRQLMSRFTNYPITVLAAQNHRVIARLYISQNRPFAEVLNIFRPLLPRILMPNKDFRNLGNIVKQSMFLDIEKGTSTGYCPVLYWFNLAESDIGCFVVAVILFIVLFFVSKKIIYLFDNGTGNMDVLWFLFVASISCEGASLGTLFGYGYTSLVYTIPILFLLRVIKIKE